MNLIFYARTFFTVVLELCVRVFISPCPYSRQLLKTAVPTVFDFPMNLQKVTKCRRELIRREPDIIIIINKNNET